MLSSYIISIGSKYGPSHVYWIILMIPSTIACLSFFVSSLVLSSLASTEQLFSFIRQKNSNSRLLINDHLFTALFECNNIFDEFGDFVLSFGWKQREYDVGPPPCRFSVGMQSGKFRTFGIRAITCPFGTLFWLHRMCLWPPLCWVEPPRPPKRTLVDSTDRNLSQIWSEQWDLGVYISLATDRV